MRDSIITRRRATRSRRRPAPSRLVPSALVWPGLRLAWRDFWRHVEHPRLVGGAVLCFPTLAVLVFLVTHLALPWSLPASALPWTGHRTPTPHPVPSSAAQRVQALSQGDPGIGWDNRAQYDAWWQSACAPAALTEVLRAWGAQTRIGAVLDQLIADQAITPQQGLLDANALAAVARTYHDQAETFRGWSLTQVAQVTGQGVPVLVDVVDARQQTPYPAFVTGHWLVVTGVSATQVQVVGSSGYHIRTLSLALWRILFTGVVTVVWQGALTLPKVG